MSELTVAVAGTEDLDALKALFLEYRGEVGGCQCFKGFDDEVASLPGEYASPRGILLLLKDGEAVAGCVALRPLQGSERCEMKRLYIRPAFRGRGGGRRLAEAAIAAARGAGYARICLETLERMVEARTLYLELGFREARIDETAPPGDLYLLELALARPVPESLPARTG